MSAAVGGRLLFKLFFSVKVFVVGVFFLVYCCNILLLPVMANIDEYVGFADFSSKKREY